MGYGGKAIVSTPNIYAKEVLGEKRGIVIEETHEPKLFTEALNILISNPEKRKEMARLAYAYSRQMTWTNVALNYLTIFIALPSIRASVIFL